MVYNCANRKTKLGLHNESCYQNPNMDKCHIQISVSTTFGKGKTFLTRFIYLKMIF